MVMSCRTSSYFSSIERAIAFRSLPREPLEARDLSSDVVPLLEELVVYGPRLQLPLDLGLPPQESAVPELPHALEGARAVLRKGFHRHLAQQPPRFLVLHRRRQRGRVHFLSFQVQALGRLQHRGRPQGGEVRLADLAERLVRVLGPVREHGEQQLLGRQQRTRRFCLGPGLGHLPHGYRPPRAERPAQLLASGRLVQSAALDDPRDPGRPLHRALDADERGQERVQVGGLAGGGRGLRLLGHAPDQPFHGLRGFLQPAAVGFGPLGLEVRVRVVARRQLDDLDAQALVEKDLEALAGGLLSRLVLVEVQDHPLDEAMEEPAVPGREGGPAGGHRLLDAGLQRPRHVEVPFHEDDPALAPRGVLGPRQAVERPALLVDRGLGGVQVLRLAAVQAARAEGHHLTGLAQDREDRAVAEPVVVPVLALALEHEPRREEDLRRELAAQRAQEVVPGVARRPRPDALQGLLLEPAAEQVLPGLGARGGPEVPGEVLGGRLHEGQDLLALLAVGPGLEAALPLGNRHPEATGQRLRRLREAHPLAQHQELEDVPALPAAEAVEDRGLGAHVEGRGLLLVERAEPLPGGPHLLEDHVLGDHAHDVRRAPDLLHDPVAKRHPYSFSSTTVTPPPPSPAPPAHQAATWGWPSRRAATALRSRPWPKPWITRTCRRSARAASSSSLSTRGSASSTVSPTRLTSVV